MIVDPYPVPPPALGETSYALIGCARARHPFAQLRSVPDATLAGAAERTVAGRRVLVLDGGVQPPEAPAGWTVRTAVVPAPGGGGVLLQVSDPDGPGTFERILASVRDGGDGGGDPGSRRISWGGASFEVPGRWGLVEAGDDCPRRPGDQVVYVGRDPAAAGCALPERYIEVTAAPAAPSSTVRLNGLDLELDANGRGNRSVRTATVADPRVRVRLVTTGAEDTSGAFDALLLSLRAG